MSHNLDCDLKQEQHYMATATVKKKRLTQVERRAQSDSQIAQQYCSLIFGAIYQWLVNPTQINLHQLLGDCKHSLTLIAMGAC